MLNKVELIGRCGTDPDQHSMPDGNLVVNLSLATSRRWKNKNTGEKVEETEWHRIVFFGKLAEIVGKYLHKGSLIRIEGRIRTRKWEKNGVDHYSTEIIADEMLMLDKKSEYSGSSDQNQPPQQTSQQPTPPSSLDDFDDVPF